MATKTSKTTTLHVQLTFVYFFAVFADYDVKMPNFAFYGDVNKQRRNFISLSELGYGPLEFKFRRVRLYLTKGLFTWSGGPRSSGVGFFCFHALADTKQKKHTPLDRGPPLHVNRF